MAKANGCKPRFDLNEPGNKVHFISLGCPRNLVDTEVMLGILLKSGYEVTQALPEADYIVVNTCGFLEVSRQESLTAIDDSIREKKVSAKIIVTGCMVQLQNASIEEQFPKVDYLLGSGDVEGILNAVKSSCKGQEITQARSYLEVGEVPRQISTPSHFAYLKIAEGCRKRCAYCIIPTIKGPLRSKEEERILKEFRTLVGQGVKEVILIAQDLGDYGKDRGEKDALERMIKKLLEVKGDYWLRLLYLYPDEITDGLIELMKSDSRLCKYLDMPLQHINNDMLKSMRRKTSREQIIDIITKLRREVPDVVIRTSLIVGFPGETEEQFEELATFIQEHPLDHIGVFQFSREPGSHAYDLPNQISEEVKRERYERLMAIQKDVVSDRNQMMVGRKISVVIDGFHPETQMLLVGRHMGQCPDIDTQVIINDARKVDALGERYLVEITDVAGYDLIGRALKKLPAKLPKLESETQCSTNIKLLF